MTRPGVGDFARPTGLLLACRAVLSWLRTIATSNRAIYCGVAFYVMFAMQWEPLWALFPFIVVALVGRMYKKRSLTGPRDRLPIAVAIEPVMDADIPVLPALVAVANQTAPSQPVFSIEDPYVKTPAVFNQEPVDWNAFKTPAWARKGLALADLLKDVAIQPAPLVIEAVPESAPVEGTLVGEDVSPVEWSHEEQQGSFIYN